MNITRQITTMEFSAFDHENLCIVVDLLKDLADDLDKHGDDFIQGTTDGVKIETDELFDVISCLRILANNRKFIVKAYEMMK